MPEVRPIDANSALNDLCGSQCGCQIDECGLDEPCEKARCIIRQPTIKPEVRHGQWIVHTTWHGMFGLIHSECRECKFDRNGDLSSWKFCPNCGVEMDGGADND